MPWGAAIGAIGGVASSMIDADNQESSTPLTSFQQLPPHMQALNQEMYNLANTQAMTPYPGFNPNQQTGYDMISNQAMTQSPYEMAAQQAIYGNAMGGMNPMYGMENPYLMEQINAMQGDMQENFNQTTVPMLDAMNTRANTGFGTSSAVDDMRTDAYSDLQDSMGKVSNDMLYKDYYNQSQLGESNANRMLQAAGMAPMMQQMGYTDANAMLNMGNQQQMAPQQYAQYQMNMMTQPFGTLNGSTVMMPGTTSPNYMNAAMGGAMAGTSIYNMVGGAPSQTPNNAAFYNDIYGFGGDMN